MVENIKNEIKLFEGNKIRSSWDNEKEEYYFSIIDVIKVLTDSSNPRDYWYRVKKKNDRWGEKPVVDKLSTTEIKINRWKAVVAAPPIAGGFVTAFEMSKTSLAKGLPHLSTIALLLLALQEFPVYFILPGLLRSETLRVV